MHGEWTTSFLGYRELRQAAMLVAKTITSASGISGATGALKCTDLIFLECASHVCNRYTKALTMYSTGLGQ